MKLASPSPLSSVNVQNVYSYTHILCTTVCCLDTKTTACSIIKIVDIITVPVTMMRNNNIIITYFLILVSRTQRSLRSCPTVSMELSICRITALFCRSSLQRKARIQALWVGLRARNGRSCNHSDIRHVGFSCKCSKNAAFFPHGGCTSP